MNPHVPVFISFLSFFLSGLFKAVLFISGVKGSVFVCNANFIVINNRKRKKQAH